ncbi:MAG: zinc-ribbon domain-containing protein, partial [Chloroflexia bacterium]|nr:zinc-ribbon domain-containing protein [Chloroflexia bacterium]
CPECGVNLTERQCPQCKAQNPPRTKFCSNCGTALE